MSIFKQNGHFRTSKAKIFFGPGGVQRTPPEDRKSVV
jgi:hypothetical protein